MWFVGFFENFDWIMDGYSLELFAMLLWSPVTLLCFFPWLLTHAVPSVLWRCWLGGRKGIRPVKKLEWWGTGMLNGCVCYTRTHTRLTALFPGLPGWAGTRKAKPIWILLNQEIVSGSGISWAICKSASRCRQITTPAPHHSVFYRPFCHPTDGVKALKANFPWLLTSNQTWLLCKLGCM